MIMAINLYLLHSSTLFCISSINNFKISPRLLLFAFIGCISALFGFNDIIFASVFTILKLLIEVVLICDIKPSKSNCVFTVFILALSLLAETLFNLGYIKAVFYMSLLFVFVGGCCLIFRFIRKYKLRRNVMTVTTNKGVKRLTVLSDSGNMLKDPINGLPVIVASVNELKDIIPQNVFFALGLSKEYDTVSNVYTIPYKTIAGSGILYGFRPDQCQINGKDIDCIIALCNNEGNFGGDCSALCNPDILEV